jgi:hypothetical protein
MPVGSAVEEVYEALLKKGYDKGKAARIAQSRTGEALATGRKPKHPVKAANTAVAAPAPSSPRPRDRRYSEYALAAANADEDAEMIRPSSERVSLSPGNHVLKELRQDNVRRQAAEKVINPMPRSLGLDGEELPPGVGQPMLDEARAVAAKAEEAAGLMKMGKDGVFQCPTCHYRADSPRPHNCEQIRSRQWGGWSGMRIPR